jgi:hypothetical protein
MKISKILSLFMAFIFVAGCASKVQQTVTKPITVQKNDVKTIYLKISHTPNVVEDGAYVNAEKELSDAIIKKVNMKMPKTNIITTQKPVAGLEANVVINEFNYISGAARVFAGALSGKAKLGAKVTLTDIASNKNVGETDLGTSSKFSEGIFGGTSSKQIDALADQIVALIKAP